MIARPPLLGIPEWTHYRLRCLSSVVILCAMPVLKARRKKRGVIN